MQWLIDVETKTLWQGELTPKAAAAMRIFGLDMERLRRPVEHKLRMRLAAGEVCYITGPSGSGKSVLLREVRNAAGRGISLAELEPQLRKAAIDCVEGNALKALRALNAAGLNDVFTALNQAGRLSAGQQYRLRLAMAISRKPQIVFADEFCSNLDRLTAAVIAWNVRKLARRTGTAFVLAASHDDIIADLQPDVLVVKDLAGTAAVIRRNVESQKTTSP